MISYKFAKFAYEARHIRPQALQVDAKKQICPPPLAPPQKHAMTARLSWLSHASSLVLLGGARLDANTWISLDAESSQAPSLSPVRILWALEKRSSGWCACSSWWREIRRETVFVLVYWRQSQLPVGGGNS